MYYAPALTVGGRTDVPTVGAFDIAKELGASPNTTKVTERTRYENHAT